MPPARFELSLIARREKQLLPYLRRHLRQAREMIGGRLSSLSIALVGDEEMSKLHQEHLGIGGPTDVLTFEIDHDERGEIIGGEIVVCTDEARRRADSMDIPLDREILLYCVHGMLHLSGFDDKTRGGFTKMHHEEDRILSALGVGPVFVPAAARQIKRRRSGKRSAGVQ